MPDAPHPMLTYVIYPIILVLVWGLAFTMIGYIVDYISPAWIVATRTGLASILLYGYMRIRGRTFPPIRDKVWLWYLFIGFFSMSAPFYLVAKGQIHIDSGLASILIASMPLMTIVLAHFFVKGEPLSWRKSIGFVIGFIGITILFLPEPLSWSLINNWQAQSLLLLAAACYAVATVAIKRAPEVPASVGGTMLVINAFILSSIWAIGSSLATGVMPTMPPPSALLALLGLAIGSTGIANILYLQLIQTSGPSLIAKINYIVPICSVLAGMLFLGEDFRIRYVIAIAIIVCGLLIVRSQPEAKIADEVPR